MEQEFLDSYWKYYLILEEEFLSTLRYVELHKDNFETFSVEYTKQYQTICSEIDVLCKHFCKIIDPSSNSKNIKDYGEIILANAGRITKEGILYPIPRSSLFTLNNFHDGG